MSTNHSPTLGYHPDVNLPIYPNEVVFSRADLTDLEFGERTITEPSFVRIARTSGPSESIHQRLGRADKVFRYIARQCGIEVIPHIWGLTERSPRLLTGQSAACQASIVPDGYFLVAKVATIFDQAAPPVKTIDAVQAGELTLLNDLLKIPEDRSYKDFGPQQLLYGSQRWSADRPSTATWMVDVEPLMGTQVAPLPEGRAFTNGVAELG